MTNIQSMDDFVSQIFAGKEATIPFDADIQTASTATLINNQSFAAALLAWSYVLPTLPAGVTAYIVTGLDAVASSVCNLLLCKAVHLGQLDISGASGTYTADATMPTITEGNNSNQTYSSVIASVNTVLNATPGSFTITYTNQAGTPSIVSPSQPLTVSAATNSAAATAGLVPLAAGDWGVSAITAAARTAGTTPTGILDFWGMIPICIIPAGLTSLCQAQKALHLSNPMRLGAADTLRIFSLGASATRRIIGNIRIVGDK